MSAAFVRRIVLVTFSLALTCGSDLLRVGGKSSAHVAVGLTANSSVGVWPWPENGNQSREQTTKRRFIATPPRSAKNFGGKVVSPTPPPFIRQLKAQKELSEEKLATRYRKGLGEKQTATETTTALVTTTTTTATATTTTFTARRQFRPPPMRTTSTTTRTTTTTTAQTTPAPPTSTTWRNATGGLSYGREPRVYFLFLAVDKISNFGLWEEFLSRGSKSQYRAFVHCKENSCKLQASGSAIESIPTVPSFYCTDLVSPMNALISYALEKASDGAHPQDKFAFVSDSTLPAKSFQDIYRTLVGRDGSDFCVFPSKEWADVRQGTEVEMAPKFHQWITLTRAHAEKASRLWAEGFMHNLMDHFALNKKQWRWPDNSYGDGRNFGCLDEFWHMAAIYGTLQNVRMPQTEHVSLDHFSGGSLHGSLRISSDAFWQGECDTFVMWSAYMHTGVDSAFERFYSKLDPESIPRSGNGARPGWWDTISEIGIKAIKDSDFLFVRKFIDHPRLASTSSSFQSSYSRIVFA